MSLTSEIVCEQLLSPITGYKRSHGLANLQAQLGGDVIVTPEPFKFKLSSQGQGRTPRVSGIENSATTYKENKAVIPRHTPFAERWAF